ncbi:MAG: AAA family ATPase [Clostridia bacterium]|nr:AAA family ATPase [Clostridia bacterium]
MPEFYRKIEETIKDHFARKDDRIIMIDGARQVGKTHIIRKTVPAFFKHFVEINMITDYEDRKLFSKVRSVEDFYIAVNSYADVSSGSKDDTIIFLDEIQQYIKLIPLLKALREDGKYSYIASGSLLGVAMSKKIWIPMGSIRNIYMYPMDFEEFLYARGFGKDAITGYRKKYERHESLSEPMHEDLLDQFRRYLVVGGLPYSVSLYLESHNLVKVREYQTETMNYYAGDAAKYDSEHKMSVGNIYSGIVSNMQNKKKRVVAKDIEGKAQARFDNYTEEFGYLANSGIALEVQAVSGPVYPLNKSIPKNLVKLYLNDPGLLTNRLYGTSYQAVMDDIPSINLGSLYETAVACELKAHGYDLYYYDNRSKGEVDFLINDDKTLGVLPIEVKSGKDYYVHLSLDTFISNPDYPVHSAYVLSNDRDVRWENNILYMPVYYIMFIQKEPCDFVYF